MLFYNEVAVKYKDPINTLPKLTRITVVAVFLWTILIMALNLKFTLPKIHWIATCAIWPLVAFDMLKNKVKNPQTLYAYTGVLFALLMVMAGIFATNKLDSMFAGSLLLMIFSSYFFFLSKPVYLKYIFAGLIFSVFLNVLLLFVGAFGNIPQLAAVNSYRWGTFLSQVGLLSQVGIVTLGYAVYLIVSRKGKCLKEWLLLTASLLLILADGSRLTAVAAMIGVFTLSLFAKYNTKAALTEIWPRFLLVLLSVAVAITLVQYITYIKGDSYNSHKSHSSHSKVVSKMSTFSHENPAADVNDNNEPSKHEVFFEKSKELFTTVKQNRVVNSLQTLEHHDVTALDPIRYGTLKAAVNAIAAHPILGTGLQTTIYSYYDAKKKKMMNMNIHNSFLQIYADFGLFPFLGFVVLMFGWVRYLPAVLKFLRHDNDKINCAMLYNAIFLLAYFILYSLFHPLSLEWQIWVLFLFPWALFMRYYLSCKSAVAPDYSHG